MFLEQFEYSIYQYLIYKISQHISYIIIVYSIYTHNIQSTKTFKNIVISNKIIL
jgi:hypothetical protein